MFSISMWALLFAVFAQDQRINTYTMAVDIKIYEFKVFSA
jgi:hypothetical protein